MDKLQHAEAIEAAGIIIGKVADELGEESPEYADLSDALDLIDSVIARLRDTNEMKGMTESSEVLGFLTDTLGS